MKSVIFCTLRSAFINKDEFGFQGMEIVQTMNSDPGLAVGESGFRFQELNAQQTLKLKL